MESNSNNSVSMLVGTKRTVSLTADGSVYKKYGIYLKKCNFDLKVDGSSYKMKFFVDRVDPNSQAYQAGIVSGDVILTVTSDVSPIARRHSTSSGSSTTSGKSTSGKKRGKGSTASSSSGMAVDSNKYDSSVLCPALNKQTYYVNNNDLGKFEEFLEQNNEITLTVIYVNAREWNRLVEGKERLEKEYREKEMSLKAVEYHLYALQNPGCSYLDFNNSSASLQSSLFTQSNPPRRSIDAQFSLPNGAKNASQFRDRLISEPGKLQKTSLSRSQPNMLNKESTKQWFPKFLMSKARKESTGSNKSIDRSTDGGALLKASISKSDRHFQASVGDNYSIDSGVGSRGRTESPFNSEAQSVRSTRRPLGDNTDTSSLCSSTPGNAKIFRSPSSMNRSPDVSNKELNSLAGGVTLPRFRNKNFLANLSDQNSTSAFKPNRSLPYKPHHHFQTPVKCNPEVMPPFTLENSYAASRASPGGNFGSVALKTAKHIKMGSSPLYSSNTSLTSNVSAKSAPAVNGSPSSHDSSRTSDRVFASDVDTVSQSSDCLRTSSARSSYSASTPNVNNVDYNSSQLRESASFEVSNESSISSREESEVVNSYSETNAPPRPHNLEVTNDDSKQNGAKSEQNNNRVNMTAESGNDTDHNVHTPIIDLSAQKRFLYETQL